MGKVVKIVAGIAIAAAAIALAAPTGGLSIAGALSLAGIAASVVGAIGAAVFATVATLALNALIPPPGTKRDPENYAQSLADSQIIIGNRYPRLSNTAFTVTNWSISPDFGVPVSVREENENMYAWTVNDEIDRGAVQTINQAQMIPDVVANAETAGTAGSAGAVSNGGITYTPAQIKQLENRIAALEP